MSKRDNIAQTGPVRANNAVKLYELFESQSELVKSTTLLEYGYPAQTLNEEIRIWRGWATKVPQEELGMLESATHHALQLLKAIGSFTLLITGNKARPSIYLMHFKPTLKSIEEFANKNFLIERRTMPTAYDSLTNDIVRLRERLDNAERRISELEGKLSDGNEFRGSQTLP